MTKTCARCKETLLLDRYHVDRGAKNGHQSWCRTCKHDRSTKKRCPRCEERKPLDQYYRYGAVSFDREQVRAVEGTRGLSGDRRPCTGSRPT